MSSHALRPMFLSPFVTACLLACAAYAQTAPPALTYPTAARGPVVDEYHGTKVADPYRWMEELDSPETRAWVTAEANVAQGYLGGIGERTRIQKRLTELYDFETYGVPFRGGARYFYEHNTGLQGQSVLLVTNGASGKPAVALDPNTLSKDGSLAIAGYVAGPGGKLLAYGVSVGGSDWTDWRVRDLATGKDLPDVIRWTKYYKPVFKHDGAGLFYSAFPAPPPGDELKVRDLGNALYYHALGTPQSADRKLFDRADHPDWQYEPHLSDDGRWLVIAVGEGQVGDKGVENQYTIDLAASEWKVEPLVEGFDAGYEYAGSDSSLLYFATTLDAPRGRVIAIDPKQRERARWKEVVPQGSDAISMTSTSVTLVGHRLIVTTLHDAHSRVSVFGLDGRRVRDVSLPGPGTATGFEGSAADRETFYKYTDLITPPTLYRYDVEAGTSTVFRAPKVRFASGDFEERQVFYPGKDGTRIPMTLAYRKGLKLDGTNPTLLYGYGGFGVSVLPTFNAARVAWMEMGGVYAMANLRGGGEYGEEWHRQGMRHNRQTAFNDFIAAAEWLIAQRYTSTPRLAIQGGSNGGLLVGACVTQRPDLYGAAVASVGVMDMLRFDQFGQGAGWVGDFGSPRDPEDFKALHAYSPYHNVRPGTHYPATLIITGDHDTRVMPAHSFKLAAAMQAAQSGPAPVLLRVDLTSGHHGGTTIAQTIEQTADTYGFLVRNLGMVLPAVAIEKSHE
jgi:prolyl oligopeptidase